MRATSVDLCKRVVAARVEDGQSMGEIARRFRLPKSTVQAILNRYRQAGTVEPKAHGGGHPSSFSSKALRARENIEAMRKRRFHGNWLAAGGAIVVGILLLLSGETNVMPGGMYFAACGGLYVASCMTPQYRLNRRVIQGDGTVGSMGLLAEMGAGEGGCFGLIFGFVIILFVMPLCLAPVGNGEGGVWANPNRLKAGR